MSPARHEPFGAVAFDCDSTLSAIEGIDELAYRAGCYAEIEPLTAMAMDGRLTLEAVYARRMDAVRPDRGALDWLAGRYLDTVTPGAVEAVGELLANGLAVHIISGGLRPAILPLAHHLKIPPPNVHAVDVVLSDAGEYLGFDTASPLARSDGKAVVCAALMARHGPTALVGDGMTDVAARAGGAFVIGFGGVVARDAVRAASDVFVADAALTATLPFLLNRRL